MRFIEFKEPNFTCTVSDPAGELPKRYYFFAKSAKDLLPILQARQLTPTSPIKKYDFKTWKDRAKIAARAANRAKNKNYDYNAQIWAEIKQYLFFLTNDRCGYCEAMVRVTSPGDVEHYRPKRTPEEDKKHPGYYWLAYDIENYVPCCTNCNAVRGKRSRFPVMPRTRRAKGPRDLRSEKPVLLNPFKQKDLHKHIEFIGPEHPNRFRDGTDRFGQLEGLTYQGKESIRIYNLNRGDLVRVREKAFNHFKDRLRMAEIDDELRQRIMAEYKAGELEYYLMLTPVVRHWIAKRELEEKAKIERANLNLKAFENERKMLGL